MVVSGRKFEKEGAITTKLSKKSSGKKSQFVRAEKFDLGKNPTPYCFLFNDILVSCDQVNSKGKEVDRPFVVNNILCLVEVKSIASEGKVIKLTLIDNSVWKLKAKTPEMRVEWEEPLRSILAKIIG